METTDEKQAPQTDLFDLRVRIMRLGITYRSIAKRLKRRESTVTAAMQGGNKKLLSRIVRYVEYLESRAAQRSAEVAA
jgi:phage shock protein A